MRRVTITLTIEPKDDWTAEVRVINGAARYALTQDDNYQLVTEQDVVARVHDTLYDVTKHDDTIAWMVTRVENAS